MPRLFFISLAFLFMLDVPVRGVITHFKTPFLIEIMGWISYLGKGWMQAIPCLTLLGAGLFVKKDTRMEEAGKKGLYAIALAGVIVQAIKHLIGRPRPKIVDALGLTLGPSFASGFDSFPSGHAASAFALASALTLFYPGMRYPLYTYGAMVSLSRVYLGAHFLSDVFAGIVLGLWIGRLVTTKGIEDIKRMLTGPGAVLGIAALSFFLSFYSLGAPGLFDVDEAVFAESAREMVETGDWVTPRYNYTNRYDKPILFYWLISSAYKLFGVNEFAARFWSATFGVVLVLFTYYFVRRIGNHRWGVLSALVLATSLEVIVLSHAAITDMTLTLFITSSLFCFFLGYIEQGGHKKWWYRGFYLSLALAVLTKGPVGVVIPALVISPFIFLRGRFKETLREMKIVSGGLIFLFVALPWYVVEIWINGWEYIDAFFIKHNFTRYTGVISGHSGPVYYFIPVVLLAFFPWSTFLPYSIVKSIRGVKLKGKLTRRESIAIFSTLWFLVVFIFFSLSKTKLPGYVAPLSPAIAILVGMIWDERILSTSERDRWLKLSLAFCSILGLLVAIGMVLVPLFLEHSISISRFLHGPVEGVGGLYLIGGGMIVGVVLFILALWRDYKTFAFGVMVGMMTFITYILLAQVVPLADRYLQSPLKDLARIAGTQLDRNGGDLVVYGLNKPSIVFYARRQSVVLAAVMAVVPGSNQEAKLTEFITSSKRVYIIAKYSMIDGLLIHPNIFLLNQQGGYALLTNQPPDKVGSRVMGHGSREIDLTLDPM